ncbi:hypothetical protein C8R44DRAFT_731343 [Mycena epipterygia]|nr:hypothetical protein C8R44DRAFT_731343 [Mycena epipterygia]
MPPGPLRHSEGPSAETVPSPVSRRPDPVVDTCCGGAIIRLPVVAALPLATSTWFAPSSASGTQYAVWPTGFDRPPGNRRMSTEGQSRSPQSVPTLPPGPRNALNL